MSNGVGSKLKVFHLDPAAQLNPTEEEWNAIVQHNLHNFELEKQRVIREKAERSRKIQEEQKKQIELKNE